MKDYLVECQGASWNNIFIIKAKNQKEAIEKAIINADLKENGYHKSDLTATSLESLYKTSDGFILVH
jgi:hypothetical protein